MSWGYRLSVPENARAKGIESVRPFNGRVVTSGKKIPYLQRRNGEAEWQTSRYGMQLFNSGVAKLFWNAKRESLETNEKWTRLIRMRIVIPVDAFVESAPTRSWQVGPRAWVPGLIDPTVTGGIVTITESNDSGGSPILLTQSAAIQWLDAKPWDAIKTLSGERESYSLADIFIAAKLDMESKSRAPIAA